MHLKVVVNKWLFFFSVSHQAKLIEVCKQPPGVDISQAGPHLQVCQHRQKHLKATKKSKREKAQPICCASIEFLIHCHKEWKTLRLLRASHWQQEKHKEWGVGFHLGLVTRLFKNHELIEEVKTFAGEEFPDGLLCLEASRVRGGAQLGGLVPQELCQRVVLHGDVRRDQTRRKQQDRKKLRKKKDLFISQKVWKLY